MIIRWVKGLFKTKGPFSITRDARKVVNGFKKAEKHANKFLKKKVDKLADNTLRRLKSATPKGHTGNTRDAWVIDRRHSDLGFNFEIRNESIIMKFLEFGTKAHGPKTKKLLYVPISKSAQGGYKKGLKWGTDYVMTKKVRGIKAHGIIKAENIVAQREIKKILDQTRTKLINFR